MFWIPYLALALAHAGRMRRQAAGAAGADVRPLLAKVDEMHGKVVGVQLAAEDAEATMMAEDRNVDQVHHATQLVEAACDLKQTLFALKSSVLDDGRVLDDEGVLLDEWLAAAQNTDALLSVRNDFPYYLQTGLLKTGPNGFLVPYWMRTGWAPSVGEGASAEDPWINQLDALKAAALGALPHARARALVARVDSVKAGYKEFYFGPPGGRDHTWRQLRMDDLADGNLLADIHRRNLDELFLAGPEQEKLEAFLATGLINGQIPTWLDGAQAPLASIPQSQLPTASSTII